MDLYIVLGLTHGAKEADIKRAYRRLARRFHPDINPGDRTAEARFQQIVDAYETLIDPERRSRYEAGGQPATAPARGTSGFEGFDFSVRGADHALTFGDLFAEVLQGRGAGPHAPERGADLHQDVRVTFEEAFTGVARVTTLTRREGCRTCLGTGVARTAGAACLVCHGVGIVRSTRGHMVFTRPCGACDGSGRQRPRPCEACAGSGQEVRSESVRVRVPPGVADGDRLRVAAKGNAGIRSGPPGDLYLSIQVSPHPVFRRQGQDLHVTVPVAIHEAALGARVDVPAPDGRVQVRVPPGTQSGQRFRLSGRGMPSRDGGRGDLLVHVHLVLPAVLDERSKALLREFGRIQGESVRGGGPFSGDEAETPEAPESTLDDARPAGGDPR
jgi:molecular chaperone DnaJ